MPGRNTFDPVMLAAHTVRDSTPEDGLMVAPKGQEAPLSEALTMAKTMGAGLESSGG
jgi:hypothetical protein